MLTQLYRYYDADGNLLYVGISKNAVSRSSHHQGKSHWYWDAVNMSMENFKTRKEAEQAERKAIKEEKPLHNKAHADMPDTVGFFHLVFKYALTKNKKYAFGAKKLFNRESMPSACHRKLWDALPD